METKPQQDKYTRPDNSLLIMVMDPEKVYFQGLAMAISSINDSGPFDILAAHENFISIIKEKVIIHLLDNKTQEIPFKHGVLKAEKNAVYVFLELESIFGKEK